MFYNNVKTFMLLGAMVALTLFVGSFFGREGFIFAVIISGVMSFVSYFFSAKIALASMHAQEVGPEHPLYRIVQKLVQRADIPMPKVYVAPTEAPNAFATGRNPRNAAVCATQGLMRMLNEDEVAGVMAHELAHVKHRDILTQSIAATMAGAFTYLGYMSYMGGGRRNEEGNGGGGAAAIGMLLALVVGPLAAGLIQAAVSRSREFNADTGGAEILGDPMPLATALEKIHYGAQRIPMDVNPAFNSMFIAEPRNLMKSMANLFATHPPLEQRLENLIGRESTGQGHFAR